jgi:hypothetical protein
MLQKFLDEKKGISTLRFWFLHLEQDTESRHLHLETLKVIDRYLSMVEELETVKSEMRAESDSLVEARLWANQGEVLFANNDIECAFSLSKACLMGVFN